MECPFCKLVKERIGLVYSSTYFSAFLDKSPVFYGHTLLVPNDHIETIFDLKGEAAKDLAHSLSLISQAVKNATSSDGILIVQNNIVSQSVPHLHFHIIPRKHNDGLKHFLWPRLKYKEGEKEKYEKLIIEQINKLNGNS
ncbi:MAG: HIT family protein [Candidatus Rehaiarchaeum fermentans]|nr:HIT family protein [Candidatus Rehaiarchaeum fermentans]MCW1302470.1 HIT family protein [Candidatus Rehaiarchaeum fermentans]